jgi:hypothetical protein
VDDAGTPSFGEVVEAFTPPGTDFEAFKASLHSQGAAGRVSPELVAMLNRGGIVPRVIAQSGTTCARCDHPHGGPPGQACLEAEAHLGRSPLRRSPDLRLDAISGSRQGSPAGAPASLPAGPARQPTPGTVAATAMHEAFLDLMAGGFTEDQALTILAWAFAARNGSDNSG